MSDYLCENDCCRIERPADASASYRIRINGVEHSTLTEAAKAWGLKYETFRRRIEHGLCLRVASHRGRRPQRRLNPPMSTRRLGVMFAARRWA